MLRKTLLTIAVGMTALAFGASQSRATIIFGNETPSTSCTASTGAGQTGDFICSNSQVFTSAAGDVLTATGLSNAPATGTSTALTLKTIPANTIDVSGLGENAIPPGSACSDPNCEISAPASVTVVDSGTTKILNTIIGSIQVGDSFNFFVETTAGGPFNELTGGPFTNACTGNATITAGPSPDECTWTAANFPVGIPGIAVEAASGNVTIVSDLTTGELPEPASLALLGTGLFGFGLMRWRRRKV